MDAVAQASAVRPSVSEGLNDLNMSAPGHQGIVFTQLSARCSRRKQKPGPSNTPWTHYYEGARLVRLLPEGSLNVLTEGFHSAADADISFDGKRILFAAKKRASEHWQIYEMAADGSGVRQITHEPGDCRNPVYQSKLYVITSDKPWYQITFVGYRAGSANLYACKLDGSAVRRLTFNPFSDVDPFLMPDGRILFAGWQRDQPGQSREDRMALFGINLDGTDYALFAGDEGGRFKRMPCVITSGLAVFVESENPAWDGAGVLAAVSLRRNLHSHRRLTEPSDGLFHSPSQLPQGRVLVSRRPADGKGNHSIHSFDPATGELLRLYDHPKRHDIQAKILLPHVEPDGRSSVVNEKDPTGKFYCLNVYTADFAPPGRMVPDTVKRLRVLEGIEPDLQTRLLGEIRVDEDGSFNIEVPANTPVRLQLVDAEGMVLQSCSWIWVRNKEPRGCIGCHEDGELTPENHLVKALARPSIPLTLPAERRRVVDFRRNVEPILRLKCGNTACHGGATPPRLNGDSDLKEYVHPGSARTSPLVWSLFGRNTSRPWDRVSASRRIEKMPPLGSPSLTDDERRTIIEWIDFGAHSNGAQK